MQVERGPQGSSGKRVSNTLVTCPSDRNTGEKSPLMPDMCAWLGPGGRKGAERPRRGMGLRRISQLAGQRPTKARMRSRTERSAGHIGTETRSRLLREAAVGSIWQWGKP